MNAAIAVNRALTRRKPRLKLSRALLGQVHAGFGGELRALFVGGAFTEPETLQFFYDLGIPVDNGYGCTEAGTAITLNDLKPFRPDTVGKPLPGMEIRIANPDAEGIGEVAVRSKTVMSHYLDDPEMTAETIVDGWLMTGDLGRLDATGHLQLFGRKKNMIVTEEGKNIYPEDIETAFEGLAVKEFCVFAANYLWPARTMVGEQLVLVLHPEPAKPMNAGISRGSSTDRNKRLLNYKRISGYLVWDRDFPLTASMKIKRAGIGRANSPEQQAAKPWCRCDVEPALLPQRIAQPVKPRFFAIVNPAAGGGRCGKLAPAALERVRAARHRSRSRANNRQRGRSNRRSPAPPMRAASAIFSRLAATARPTKSSTAFSRRPRRAAARARLSCRSAPAIHSCATSPRAASSTRSRPSRKIAAAPAT